MSFSPEQLQVLYTAQLMNGCNSVKCENPSCRSCPKFNIRLTNRTSVDKIASKMVKEHDRHNKLCKTISPLLLRPDILSNIVHFSMFANDFIHDKNIDPEKATFLNDTFSEPLAFSHIFLARDGPLSQSDLNINEELAMDIHRTCSNRSNILENQAQNFLRLIQYFTSSPIETTDKLRGLLLLFCFPSLFPDDFEHGLKPVIQAIFDFSEEMKNCMFNTLSDYLLVI